MSGFLNFHRLAAARGDGLHPRLLELLEQRAHLIEGARNVIEINSAREGPFTQAGPGPMPRKPDFLPGNVVDFAPRQAVATLSRKKTSNS